jgi:hypothetical protein
MIRLPSAVAEAEGSAFALGFVLCFFFCFVLSAWRASCSRCTLAAGSWQLAVLLVAVASG